MTHPSPFAALWIVAALACSPGFAADTSQSITVSPWASFAHSNDGHAGNPLAALADGNEPKTSGDRDIPRFTFWNHKGTTEWVQLNFDRPLEVRSVEVYWFDDRPQGGCRVPESWEVLYENAYSWSPASGAAGYAVKRDKYNKATFPSVVTGAVRIRVNQQSGFSSGILECKINGQTLELGRLGGIGVDKTPLAQFDYPKTRLALSTLAETFGNAHLQARSALVRFDRTAQQWFLARVRVGLGDVTAIGQLKQAARLLAEIEKRHDVDAILPKLNEASPSRCLQLMIRLDWLQQDTSGAVGENFLALAHRVVGQLAAADSPNGTPLQKRLDEMASSNSSPVDPRWMDLYLKACDRRRAARMGPHVSKFPKLVFTRHHDIGGQHYAYTEDVSDSPYNDNNPFPPGGQLCLLEMDGLYGQERVLLDEPEGIIRDPDVSYDGRRILFAWRKSMRDDDYHLYEMTAHNGSIRQLTSGAGVADYEGVYLPGGGVIFNSTRCQQIVDCWWADVSNLYTCDSQGRFLRRLSFDQVHTNYPQVTPDGRVIYTRWDYNDRGQLFPQPLFQMNPDGTHQREFYGNNSWFPTTILHARAIPGTQKLLAVLSGHHTYQKGKLAVIDPARGRQENAGVQLIAPVRETEAVRIDKYGYQGEQFQYPYPLSETEFLVTYSPRGSPQGRAAAEQPFGIYFITIDGARELLAAVPHISSSQPVPLVPRPEPRRRPTRVDYRKSTGTYLVHDVYAGPGLSDIPRGTIKKLRVVALEFRAAGVGKGRNRGPAGGALVSTPISINGAWDVKRVLGTATVRADGSAAFTVPARTPLYFQALDKDNHAVQSMRSWSTLQPGETRSCVGCHEHKNAAPPSDGVITLAIRAGPESLQRSGDPTEGFSFPRQIQPILDRHCTACHNRQNVADGESTISLEGAGPLDQDGLKRWSDAYRALADPKITNWISPQSAPPMLPPYAAGAAKSKLIEMLIEGHEDVELSADELDKIACWIDLAVPFSGEYTEAMDEAHVPQYNRWLTKRKHWEADEQRNIKALLRTQTE